MPPKPSRKRARKVACAIAGAFALLIALASSRAFATFRASAPAPEPRASRVRANAAPPPFTLDPLLARKDARQISAHKNEKHSSIAHSARAPAVARASTEKSTERALGSARTPASRRASLALSGFHPLEHFEASGDVVHWGDDFIVANAEACHDACVKEKDKGCNAWVFCPVERGCGGQKYKCCWLKKQRRPWTLLGGHGKAIAWTSGGIYEQDDPKGDRDPSRKFHVVVTTNNAIYQAWQLRVMYYHYKKQKAAQGDEGQMGGFTRILHDTSDGLEREIPTCMVDRLKDELGFVVLSRPYAFEQFFTKCPEIEEDYILMAEPDHVYIKPVPNLMNGNNPAAFPFFYMTAHDKPDIVRRFLPGITDAEMFDIDPIGSSPTFISKVDLKRLAPEWTKMSVALQSDAEAKKAWGWVIEMYGYTLAAYKLGIAHDLRPLLQAQPPWDTSLSEFISIHYTYGMDYDLKGKFTPGKMGAWRFDKRSYSSTYPPRNLPPPPPGVDNDLVRALIDAINEASAVLPDWGMWHGKNLTGSFH